MVLAEHCEAPVKLTSDERDLLDEALRRGEDLREEVETSVTTYGRWLLGSVFGGDSSAALDDKSNNAVWRELVRRAGGPTLRIGRRMLYVALQLAARDKRVAETLTRRSGRGSSRRNIEQMRAFYLAWPIPQTASAISPARKAQTLSALSGARSFALPWSHYVRPLSVTNASARAFYETEALGSGWTKDESVARYALDGLPNKVLAAEHRTTLPQEKVLVHEIETTQRLLARHAGPDPQPAGQTRKKG